MVNQTKNPRFVRVIDGLGLELRPIYIYREVQESYMYGI